MTAYGGRPLCLRYANTGAAFAALTAQELIAKNHAYLI